jgi:hypothetical protein
MTRDNIIWHIQTAEVSPTAKIDAQSEEAFNLIGRGLNKKNYRTFQKHKNKICMQNQ